jgi:hemerythrin-like metal-binding protein
MTFFQWSDDLSVGVNMIDSQHKKLIALINKLSDSAKGKGEIDPYEVFAELSDYVSTHFSDEEALMIDNNYAGYDSHVKEHNEFTQEMLRFRQLLDSGDILVNDQILTFLKGWLFNHIMKIDKQLSSLKKAKT